jgi:hypothetical protein
VGRDRRRNKGKVKHWDPGRDTWGLKQGSNELRVDKAQDGVEWPNPPEVDITEVVAQLLHQSHAFLVALRLEKEETEQSWQVEVTTAPLCPPHTPFPFYMDCSSGPLAESTSVGPCLSPSVSVSIDVHLSLTPHSLHLSVSCSK